MRMDPKTAGAYGAGAFIFLMIFGLGWPGPGTWLLVFALLFMAAAAVAWWLDSVMVPAGGGAVTATPRSSPFQPRRASGGRRDSRMLSLGLPGPDASGRWVLPNKVHVTVLAALIGLLAMILFISGAVGGGSPAVVEEVPVVQPNPALDFARPVTPIVQASTDAPVAPVAQEPTPIIVPQPPATPPEPARPLNAPAAPTDPAQTIIHDVVAGDTIYDLAITYNTSIEAIMNANGISEFDTIRVDERLIIPAGPSESSSEPAE